METGLIILIVTIVAFAAMVVFMLATGFNNQWPDGARFVVTRAGTKLTLIVDPAVDPGDLTWMDVARDFSRAQWATSLAAQAAKKADEKALQEIAVLLMEDAEYEARTHPAIKNSGAHQVWVGRRIGHGPILVVMRRKLVDHARKTGEPIIHELIHAAGGDRNHQDASWWTEFHIAPDSVQANARDRYLAT